jgi:hypothetical protein
MSFEEFEIINAYLKKQLSEKDRSEFEDDLSLSENRLRNVRLYKDIFTGLEAIGVEKKVQEAHGRYKKSLQFQKKTVLPFWLRKGWSIAAMITIVLSSTMGIWYYQKSNISEEATLFAQHELEDISLKSYPSNTETVSRHKAEWYMALVYVKKRDKQKANGLLERIARDKQHAYRLKALQLLKELNQ